MALTDFLDKVTLTRRLVSSLERIATAMEQQNGLLLRLADHFSPLPPLVSEEDLRTSGPSFHRNDHLARFHDWYEGFVARQGRLPHDEEIEEWIAEDAERDHG